MKNWIISICGGAGLTRTAVLQSIGMRSVTATKLASAVVASENKLGADKRTRHSGGFSLHALRLHHQFSISI